MLEKLLFSGTPVLVVCNNQHSMSSE